MMTEHPPPALLAEELRKLAALQLSWPAKLRYVLLLIVASIKTAVIAGLWLTEPRLPLRASVALVVMALIGASWIGFASWVLLGKRILLGRERVVASRLALAFSAAFTVGSCVIGYTTGQPAALVAAAFGVVLCGVAVAMWIRARSLFAALSMRRETLQRELRGIE